MQLGHLPAQLAQLDGRHLEAPLARLQAGEIEQILGEPGEPLRLPVHDLHEAARRLLLLERAGEQRLGGAADGGHRRAQLVGGVGYEVAPGGGGPPLLGHVARQAEHLTAQQRGQEHREGPVLQLDLQPPGRALQGPAHGLGQLAAPGDLERGQPGRPAASRERVEGPIADPHPAVDRHHRGGVGQGGQQLGLGRIAHGGEAAQLPLQQQAAQLGDLLPEVGVGSARELGAQRLDGGRQRRPSEGHGSALRHR